MKLSRERVLLLALLAAVVAVWWIAGQELTRGLTITVFDVGQGDCILVQAPGGRTMLVDGGGMPGQYASGYDVGREVVVPALLTRGVGRIDVLVITHPHEDHIGGICAVLAAVPVRMVLDPMLPCDSESYQRVCEEAQRRGIPVHRATEGQRLNLGEDIYVDILNPPDPRLTDTGSDLNDNSVVLRLVHGGLSVLLAADVERAGAMRLARLGNDVRSTVLKVPHHGSAGPAVPAFLEAVSPELAIVSVGAQNPFGHPSPEMLRELERVEAKVMRTDADGAVTVKLQPPQWSAWGGVPGPGARRLVGGAATSAAREER
jgi:competence protein ComEC